MTTLSFVEASEYRKEVARGMARRLLDQVGINGLLEAGPAISEELLAALAEDLAVLTRQALRDAAAHAEALGMAEAVDAEATLSAAVERVLTAARTTLAARLGELDATVERMLARTGAEAVAASLASEATVEALLAPLYSLLSATGAGLVSAVESEAIGAATVATDQAAPDGEPMLWEWQTREDDRVCEDVIENSCRPRHGRQLQLDEWDGFGPPQAETLICTIYCKTPAASNCRCILIPADSAAVTPEPVNIAEAAARGKERGKAVA